MSQELLKYRLNMTQTEKNLSTSQAYRFWLSDIGISPSSFIQDIPFDWYAFNQKDTQENTGDQYHSTHARQTPSTPPQQNQKSTENAPTKRLPPQTLSPQTTSQNAIADELVAKITQSETIEALQSAIEQENELTLARQGAPALTKLADTEASKWLWHGFQVSPNEKDTGSPRYRLGLILYHPEHQETLHNAAFKGQAANQMRQMLRRLCSFTPSFQDKYIEIVPFYLSPWRPPGERRLTPQEALICQKIMAKTLMHNNITTAVAADQRIIPLIKKIAEEKTEESNNDSKKYSRFSFDNKPLTVFAFQHRGSMIQSAKFGSLIWSEWHQFIEQSFAADPLDSVMRTESHRDESSS